MLSTDQKKILTFFCGLLIMGGSVLLYKSFFMPIPAPVEYTASSANPAPTLAPDHGYVHVHVAGAVQTPGIYRLPKGARASDAIKAAGGPLALANLDKINLVATLKDGKHLLVPKLKPNTLKPIKKNQSTPHFPISINKATSSELQQIPGIGPAMAQRILQTRSQKGHFTTLQDILAVKGIGPKTLAKLEPYFRF